MKYWTYVVIEGHCFGEEDENGHNPCGVDVPSPRCLGNGKSGMCPHFAWTPETEREAAFFVPIKLILKDKFIGLCHHIWDKIEWYAWGQLWFNRRKVREFFDNIEVVDDTNPSVQRWLKQQDKSQTQFEKWLPKVKKDWDADIRI